MGDLVEMGVPLSRTPNVANHNYIRFLKLQIELLRAKLPGKRASHTRSYIGLPKLIGALGVIDRWLPLKEMAGRDPIESNDYPST